MCSESKHWFNINWLAKQMCVYKYCRDILQEKQRREIISPAVNAFVRAWPSHLAEEILIVFQPAKGVPLI